MSSREIIICSMAGIAATAASAVAVGACGEPWRIWIGFAIGTASATTWALSAYLYRRARLAACISLVAATLSGDAGVVAVAPAAGHGPPSVRTATAPRCPPPLGPARAHLCAGTGAVGRRAGTRSAAPVLLKDCRGRL